MVNRRWKGLFIALLAAEAAEEASVNTVADRGLPFIASSWADRLETR